MARVGQRLRYWFLLCLLGINLLLVVGCQPTPTASPDGIQITLWHGVNPPANREVLQTLVDLNAIRPLDDWLATSSLGEQLDSTLLESMTLENHLWSDPVGDWHRIFAHQPDVPHKSRLSGVQDNPACGRDFSTASNLGAIASHFF
jgi:hypothetical protein